MQFRFVHAADIHLGHEQYNLTVRADDFARAYLSMIDYAVEHAVDFVIIAGDLFHHARADAWTLKQAIAGLEQLRDAGIPVVAIEGNHDAQHYEKNLSWMEFLCHQDLLTLLNMQKAANGLKSLEPFDPVNRHGSWVDLAGARIYGLKYYGAVTPRLLEELGPQVVAGPDGYTIFMLHTGMQGQIPNMHGGLTPAQLAPLRPAVDYVALGHVHKRLREDWIFNPGSTETNSMDEMDWDHGFFDVTVDTEATPKHRVQAIEIEGTRPFRRIVLTADADETLDAFVGEAEDRIAATRGIPPGAVVELSLMGTAGFRRQDIPLEGLKALVESRFAPLVTRVRNTLVPPGVVRQPRGGERLPRAELERQIVEQLVHQNPDYRVGTAAWARLILDVKRMATEKQLPASIADHVRQTMKAQEATGHSDTEVEEAEVAKVAEAAPAIPQMHHTPVGAPQTTMEGPFNEYDDVLVPAEEW